MADFPRLGDNNELDLPFEKGPAGQTIDLSDGHLAAGLVVLAAVVPVEGVGQFPALAFRFTKPDGSGFYPPMLLVIDEGQMAKVGALVIPAADAAIVAARKANETAS